VYQISWGSGICDVVIDHRDRRCYCADDPALPEREVYYTSHSGLSGAAHLPARPWYQVVPGYRPGWVGSIVDPTSSFLAPVGRDAKKQHHILIPWLDCSTGSWRAMPDPWTLDWTAESGPDWVQESLPQQWLDSQGNDTRRELTITRHVSVSRYDARRALVALHREPTDVLVVHDICPGLARSSVLSGQIVRVEHGLARRAASFADFMADRLDLPEDMCRIPLCGHDGLAAAAYLRGRVQDWQVVVIGEFADVSWTVAARTAVWGANAEPSQSLLAAATELARHLASSDWGSELPQWEKNVPGNEERCILHPLSPTLGPVVYQGPIPWRAG
jgi:hypothetical protein